MVRSTHDVGPSVERRERGSASRRVAVTLTDVARDAGVSLATASRVLNGSDRTPAKEIATRVRSSARRLGYVANAQAQALARSATGLIGLIVHDIADPYFSAITAGAQAHAGEHRSQVLLAGAARNQQAERRAVAAFVSYRTDAIILVGSRRVGPDRALATDLGRYVGGGGRVVTLGPSTIPGARFVRINNRAAAASLVAALIDRGVREFVVLAGPPELETARQRVLGYLDALEQAGRTPLTVVPGDFNREGGLSAAQDAWEGLRPRQRSTRPCLLAANDVMALGAVAGLRALGLTVPDDVQVAGFDDIPTLLDFRPALTTVRLPLARIGEQAAALALAPEDPGPVEVDGVPVVRESAG